jgi:hypothetical protein
MSVWIARVSKQSPAACGEVLSANIMAQNLKLQDHILKSLAAVCLNL